MSAIFLNRTGDFDPSDVADCPGRYTSWDCPEKWRFPLFGMAPIGVAMTSSILSVLGATLTIIPYLLWKDVRTGVRRIITFLALSDLLTATSYLMGSINYLSYTYTKDDDKDGIQPCQRFYTVCEIQSFLSCWFSMSSFLWTAILALYLYRKIKCNDVSRMDRWFPIMHVISWGLPIILVFPLLATGYLGYSTFAAGGWCFVKADNYQNTHTTSNNFKMSLTTIVVILVGGKALEISIYVWVLVLFYGIYHIIHKKNNDNLLQSELAAKTLLRQVENKLYAIPFVFIVLRIWGTLQFILSTVAFNTHKISSTGCLPMYLYYIYFVLAIIQSVGDGGQGWCNFLLYVLWSHNIRVRMLCNPFRACCLEVTKYFVSSSAPSQNYGIINGDEGESSNSSVKYKRKMYLNQVMSDETSPLLYN